MVLDDFKEWIDDNSTIAFVIGIILFILICFLVSRCSTDKPTYKLKANNCTNIIGIYDQSGEIVCSFDTDLWFSCSEKIREPNKKYRPLLGC